MFQIPAPFDNLAGSWINSYKTKRINSMERKNAQGKIYSIRRIQRHRGFDNLTPADSPMFDLLGDGIPVDESKRGTVIIYGNPCSPTALGREEHAPTIYLYL